MANDISNDNGIGRAPFPGQMGDANGQAAILLVESLIHGLIARSAISAKDAIEIVDIAADTNREIMHEYPDESDRLSNSLSIIDAISFSLKTDMREV